MPGARVEADVLTPFRCEVVQTGTESVVQIGGELDMSTETTLADCLGQLDGQVHLDCRELTFIDSRGISLLVRTHSRLDAEGGKLVILKLSPTCRRPIELMHLEELLHLVD
jgi:anti-anti-sigma factor